MNFGYTFFILTILLTLACQDSQKPANNSVKSDTTTAERKAKVSFFINDRPVYEDDLVNGNIDLTINKEIIYESALMNNYDEDPEITKTIEGFKKNLIVGKLKGKIIGDYLNANVIDDEKINQYYNDNKKDFLTLDLLQISADEKDKIEDLKAKLDQGEDIDQLITELNDIGVKINKRQINNSKFYIDKFTEIKEGALSDIISKGNTYVFYKIIKLNEPELRSVKPKILYKLRTTYRKKAIDNYIENMKSDNKINIRVIDKSS